MLDLKIATDGDHCAGCGRDLTGSGTIAIRNDECFCRKCIAAGQTEAKTARKLVIGDTGRVALAKPAAT